MSQTEQPITALPSPPRRTRADLGQPQPLPAPGLRIAVTRTDRPAPHPAPETLRFGEVFTDHMFLLRHTEQAGWSDARLVPHGPLSFSPAAAGLHYGQAMFEGLKAVRGPDDQARLFRLEAHCHRMAKGAPRLCIPSLPAATMREAILAFCRLERDWVPAGAGTALYLRPAIVATEPFLGVRPAKEYLFFIIASPVGPYFDRGAPLRLRVEDRYTRAATGGLGAVKAAANYAASLRAAEEAKAAGYAQVLWTDARHHSAIEEAGTMNVFVKIGDEVATPPLSGTLLAGVTRDATLTLLGRWGIPVRERRVTMEEILEAKRTGRLEEMWGTGTGANISPIGELGWKRERIVVGDGGQGVLSRRLLSALREIQAGVAPDPDGWTTVV